MPSQRPTATNTPTECPASWIYHSLSLAGDFSKNLNTLEASRYARALDLNPRSTLVSTKASLSKVLSAPLPGRSLGGREPPVFA